MATDAQELARLRRDVERLRGAVSGLERAGRLAEQSQSRLAVTKAAEGLAYPSEGSNPTVFPFAFLDASYERVQGPGSLVETLRQPYGVGLAYNLDAPEYIPVNSIIRVWWAKGGDGQKYWFIGPGGGSNTPGGSGGTDTFAVVVQGALTADMAGSAPRAAAGTFDEVYATTTDVPGCTDATTGSVTAIADSGSGKAQVTIGAHSITAGRGILLSGVSSAYNGWWRVLAATATTVTIDAQFGAAASSGSWSAGGSAINVIDPTDRLWRHCQAGARFAAVWQRESNEWHAIYVEQRADVIEFEVLGSPENNEFDMEDATATVTFRHSYNGTEDFDSGDQITVRNPVDHGGDSGGTYLFFGDPGHTGRAKWDWQTGEYVIHEMHGCGSTVDDLRSDDASNAVSIGSDGLLFVDKDARSTDIDNLMSEGSDGLASLTSSDVNSGTTSGNLLSAAAADGLALTSAMVKASTSGNLATAETDGLSITAVDIVDVASNNLASVGPNQQVFVDPDDVAASIPHEELIRMSVDASQGVTTSATKLTFASDLGSDAAWNFDAANDELEYTGSPDRVEVRICLTHIMAAAGADLRFVLKRGGATVATSAYKPGDTLTHPGFPLVITDFSPGSNPVYTIEHLCGSSTATISSTALYQEYVEAAAIYR